MSLQRGWATCSRGDESPTGIVAGLIFLSFLSFTFSETERKPHDPLPRRFLDRVSARARRLLIRLQDHLDRRHLEVRILRRPNQQSVCRRAPDSDRFPAPRKIVEARVAMRRLRHV